MHGNPSTESPQTKKRIMPNLKPLVEFASPFTDNKRLTPKQPSQFLTGLASGIKSPTIGGLLQNNSNHVSNRSIFSSGNRNNGSSTGLDALREKLKNAAHPSPASTEKKESTVLSEHQSTLAAYKERAKNKKSRNTAANIKEIVGSGSPIKEASAWQENDRGFGESTGGDSRQNVRKNPKSKLKRTNSMDMFRNLHKDEDFTIKFPSLLERYLRNI